MDFQSRQCRRHLIHACALTAFFVCPDAIGVLDSFFRCRNGGSNEWNSSKSGAAPWGETNLSGSNAMRVA